MRIFIPILAALAGFAGGWFLSPLSSTDDGEIASPDSSGKRLGSRTVARASGGGRASASISENLETAFRSGRVSFTEMRALMDALAMMDSGNASDFADFFNKTPFKIPQMTLWQMFFSAWGEIDPQAAIAFIEAKFSEGSARRMFYASVVETWKNESFTDVLEFALENFQVKDDSIDPQLALEYLRALAETDPDAALALSMKLNDGEFVLDMTARQITELAKKDRNAALEAIELLSGDTHFHAASQFVIDWASEDPAGAAGWLMEQYDERYAVLVIGEVAKAYAKTNPAAAMQWISELPDPRTRPAAYAKAIDAWVEVDPAGASAWLKDRGTGPESDAALVAFSHYLSDENPQEVIEEWVPLLSDAQQGHELLAEVSTEWERANPGEYAQWLEQTEAIPQEVKQRLLARESPGDDPRPGPLPGETSTGIDQGRDR